MDDLERFGSRLEASLRRLAEEIPTEVEADVYASDVVRLAGRRHRLAVPWGRIDLALPRPLRLALVLAALVALALGMLLVAQGVRPAVHAGPIRGELRCDGAPSLATMPTVELVCDGSLPGLSFAGTGELQFEPPTDLGSILSRHGQMSLRGSGAAWSGPIRVNVDTNGLIAGDASLTGDGVGAGFELRVRLLTLDGRRWGVLGTVEHIR